MSRSTVTRVVLLGFLLACVVYMSLPGNAAFWSVNYAVNQIGPTPTVSVSPSSTPTPPPGALSLAVTAMLADQTVSGVTNPIPQMCASYGSNHLCASAGSANISSVPTNGTDAGPALQNALALGDVNLPAATYTVNTSVTVPANRLIQCQPGATLTTTSTNVKVFSITNFNEVSIIGCNFVGPGNVTTVNPAYAIYNSGGNGIDVIGNNFTGWPSQSAVNFASGNGSVIMFNTFSGNNDAGINLGTSTHIQKVFNQQNGVLTPKIPNITIGSGGTQREHDLWTLLNAVGATGNAATAGYSVVQPGAVFGGVTCAGNGTTDDTQCIKNALANAASTTGILLMQATGNGYNIGAPEASEITGAQVANKTILCVPGARFYNPLTSTSGNPTHVFNMGWGGTSGGSNVNFVGCEFFGTYQNGPPGSQTAGQSYAEMIEIGNQQAPASSQITAIGTDMEHCKGDCFITYSDCGTGTACSGLGGRGSTAATSGPNDSTVLFSYFNQSNQSCIHWNGGQNNHLLFNSLLDCSGHPEIDTPTPQQVVGADEQGNYVKALWGEFDNTGSLNKYIQPDVSCVGRQDAGADSSRCFMNDNLSDGTGTVNVSPNNFDSTFGGFEYPNIAINVNVSAGCSPPTINGSRGINNGTTRGSNGDNNC